MIKVKISLKNIVKNALTVKKALNKGVRLCAVVKGDAYGHGGAEVSNALYQIADCFAVSTVEEGASLRIAGIDKDIILLIPPTKDEIERCVDNDLIIGVDSLRLLKKIYEESLRQAKKIKINLAFNSGMNRIGTKSLYSLNKMCAFFTGKENIVLHGLYSHLAKPQDKKELKSQADKFLLAKKTVCRYNNNVICHISASGGFIMGYQFDMVRIGILLYGYTPFKTDKIKVYPAMKIYAPFIKTVRLKKGQGALYGLKKAKRNLSLSLVRYGYKDGLPRKQIKGQFSNRCMDLTAVYQKPKNRYCLIMDDAERLAKQYKTISYEVLCSVGQRCQRIYLK